jgi:hypothetical protein
MRHFLFTFLILTGLSATVFADQSEYSPFAVVELFSSEGSSNCPAADLLLSKVIAWARQNNKPVYPLNFHVDYWNNLGWRDVFGQDAFSQRQRMYAAIFKDQGIYVPQLIVNGSDAFHGSDQDKLQKALDRELSADASVKLNITLIKQEEQVVVNYHVDGFADGDVLNFALVQRGLSTDVTAGENAGRTLHFDNVVREFQTIPITQAASQVVIPINKISDTAQASVIAFVQSPQTMLIDAAQQVDLEND